MSNCAADDLPRFLARLGDLAREFWQSGAGQQGHRDKGQGLFDPVTALDLAIERAMRTAIISAFPGDSVWGEEEGWSNHGGERVWSLDPVDGTRALICGLPSWAVLVGVVERGTHVAGMIDLPVLEERLVACAGSTLMNDVSVRTSGCTALAEARLSTTDPFLFDGNERAGFERVRQAALVTRFGLDALGYARIATGEIDLVVENRLKRHDLDALVPVVRGAGGHVGDWSGGEDWEGGRIVAAASAALYKEAVALLSA